MEQYNIIDVLVSFVLALIMFGIGLSLNLRGFANVVNTPKNGILGLGLQMIALPFMAFVLSYNLPISSEFKVGFIILATCPGGTTSNFITFILKGNTPLSISMTAVNSIITLVSIPIIVNLGLSVFLGSSEKISLPYVSTITQIMLITIVPALIGIYTSKYFPKLAVIMNQNIAIGKIKGRSIEFNILKVTTIVLLGIVFTIKIFANKDTGGAELTPSDFKTLLPVGLVFNFVAFFFAYGISLLTKIDLKSSTTIGIEVGLQNTTLAFLIAGTFLQNTEMQKPALVYAFFSFWTTILYGIIARNSKKIRMTPQLK